MAIQVYDIVSSLLLTNDMKESTRKIFIYKATFFLLNRMAER